jgi:hypothetical protein
MKTCDVFKYVCLATIIIVASCFVTGCQKEDSDFFVETSLYETYLSIENFSSKTTFSNAEQEIIKEAMGRIEKYIQIADNHWIISKTYRELNMEEDIYSMFKVYISFLGDYQQQNIKSTTIRLKSGGESSNSSSLCSIAYTVMKNYLQSHFSSTSATTSENNKGAEFSVACFNHYWSGTGNTMYLTAGQFSEIKKFIPSQINSSGLTPVNILGQIFYKKSVSFYSTPYALSLGSATIIYNANFQPVGLTDTYDFNTSGWNNRPGWNDEITWATGVIGTACGAKDYDIRYGTY